MTSFSNVCLRIFGGGCFILIVTISIRTITFPSKQPQVKTCDPSDRDFIELTTERLAHFQNALQLKTISWTSEKANLEEILKFHTLIEQSFPKVHSSAIVKREVIANYSLLYTIQGSDPTLKPYLLCSHLDVVPVDGQDWEVPPFSGDIVDGFVYGRGTIDVKNTVMGIMEALEFRLIRGDLPVRSFYIAYGHDEEVAGPNGARNIAKQLEARGVEVEYLLDEGTVIVQGIVPGIHQPVACISVTEKGSLTLNVSIDSIPSGHSSMPTGVTNIGVLADAVKRIENNPLPSMFGTGPEMELLEAVAAEASYPIKIALTNMWLFGPAISWFMSRKPAPNALIRTTTAVTIIGGGTKLNVLPPSAWFVVNHRIHPSQTVQEVLEYDQKMVNDDRFNFKDMGHLDPAPVSPHGEDVFGYQAVIRSVKQVFPTALVAPSIMIGNTDTGHYLSLTNKVYRFCPTVMLPSDLPRYHGVNERIHTKNYEQTINFFYHLMINSDEKDVLPRHSHSSEL